MDNQSETRDFLATRRAKITPEQAPAPRHPARLIFLDSRAHGFYPDWERAANDTVAILRTEPGSPTGDALRLLASWAASQRAAQEPLKQG